jgi:hypothetical protein
MSFWKRSAPAAGSKWRNDGPVCSLPKPRPAGIWSLLISGRKRTSPSPAGGSSGAHRAERNTASAAARNERNRLFRDGHHIGERNSAVNYCRSDGFELPHVRSSQPLNDGNSDTQDQFACRCRRIDHGRRDRKLGALWTCDSERR